MSVTLEQVLEQVKTWTTGEQRQLRDALDELLAGAPTPPTEDEFEQELLKRGLLTEIPPPPVQRACSAERKLVMIKGKPLSETIIEERR